MKSFIITILVFLSAPLSYLQAQENKEIIQTAHRLSPKLQTLYQSNQLPNTLRIKVSDSKSFLTWSELHGPSLSVISFHKKDSSVLLIGQVNQANFQKLLQCEHLQFIDLGLRPALEERENDLTGFRVNRVSLLHSKYPELNGAGLNVSVKEGAFDKNDIDFRGRVPQFNNFPSINTTHATDMASLIAGGGNSSPLGKGVAWKSNLFTASFANLFPDDTDELLSRGISVQNHSYGVGIENYYGIETQAYDEQCNQYPSILHVFSAGNAGNQASQEGTYAGIEGFANLTAQFKMSKNTLSVGEIDAQNNITMLSSRGPAYDGRVKPEVVAYGGEGSSESAALVSGISLLIQQAYQDEYAELPTSSLVKAALINSAEDLGRAAVDYEYGFGKVNALEAVESIKNQSFIQGSILSQEEKIYTIEVPAGSKLLKVTLVWNDSVTEIDAPQALVNDLDISLQNVNTSENWLPWSLSNYPHPDSLRKNAVRRADHLNNIEQITLEFPEAGTYQIKIKGFEIQTTSQTFSVVYSYQTQAAWVYPTSSDFLRANREIQLEWTGISTAEQGVIELKYTEGDTWHFLGNVEDVSQGKYIDLLPDTLALIQLRVRSASAMLTSDVITVTQPIIPRVGFDCPEELLLYWKPIAGVASYEVFTMGEQYLESYTTVSDTLLVIDKSQVHDVYFALAPVFEDETPKGLTINYTFQSLDCYIRTLLLLDIVNDTIRLDLQLGTAYGLASVALQRKENDEFKTIQTLQSPQDVRLLLGDNSPQPYRNVYRIELNNAQGQKYYSNEVEAFYIPKNEYYLFPNPAKTGETVVLIDEIDAVEHIVIYNSQGIKLREFEISEVFKEIDTDDLMPGLYFLYLSNSSGKLSVKRLVVL